jgi:CrcB protein
MGGMRGPGNSVRFIADENGFQAFIGFMKARILFERKPPFANNVPQSGISPRARSSPANLPMLNQLGIALGGALGTLARFWISGLVAARFGETFPLGTLVINVSGSFIIGFFAALTSPDSALLVRPEFRNFFMIGVCGGYTTFSSFSLQTLTLAREGEWFWAGGNIVLSVVLSLAAVWLGYVAALMLTRFLKS